MYSLNECKSSHSLLSFTNVSNWRTPGVHLSCIENEDEGNGGDVCMLLDNMSPTHVSSNEGSQEPGMILWMNDDDDPSQQPVLHFLLDSWRCHEISGKNW